MYEPHICDNCMECVKACPGRAISEKGKTDSWRCAVYYNGGNGSKNPFMPPDAFNGFDNRFDIINGTADLPRAAEAFLAHIGEARIVAFYGAMGAGKTTFITAVCEALGVRDVVNSPTFTIVNEYRDRRG